MRFIVGAQRPLETTVRVVEEAAVYCLEVMELSGLGYTAEVLPERGQL